MVFLGFWDVHNGVYNGTDGQVGLPSDISSWLLPKDVIQTDKPRDLAGGLSRASEFGY